MDRQRAIVLVRILSIPPPDDTVIFQNFINLLLLITRPPPDPVFDLYTREFIGRDEVWVGRDVFRMFATHRYEFFRVCGETPETLLKKLRVIGNRIHDTFPGRPHKLSPINRLMLVMLWLKSYPCYVLLSLLFDVSIHAVSEQIKALIPVLWEIYSPNVTWPSPEEWRQLRGGWTKLPTALAAIDGTSHHIYRQQIEPQEQFYSGHRNFHCIHTQVVIDNRNCIRFIRSGFLGHQNDAQQYNLLPSIGSGMELDFPPNHIILADKIYPNRPPLVTPYRRHQLRQKPRRERKKCKQFNLRLSECRVYVEHAIRRLKTFKAIGTLWRHPREKINQIVELCAGLVEKQIEQFQE